VPDVQGAAMIAADVERDIILGLLRDRMRRHLDLARTFQSDPWAKEVHHKIADALSQAIEEISLR